MNDSRPSAVAGEPLARRYRTWLTWLARLLVGIYFVCALTLLAVRHWVLPNANAFRHEIAAAISESLALPVSIGAVTADWTGLHPTLGLADVSISDAQGHRALGFSLVEATLSWRSLVHRHPVFRRIEIHGPELDIRRDAQGRVTVAGWHADATSDGGGFAAWILDQPEIRIRDGSLVWSDALRDGPPLVLGELNLRLEGGGKRHRFGFTARPTAELAGMVDVRGDLFASDLRDWSAWRGELFVALRGAQLGGWQPWANFAVPLAGSGDAKFWIRFGGPQTYSARAEFVLEDAQTRLREDLPELRLRRLAGGVQVQRMGRALHLETHALQAAGEGGLALERLDLSLDYDPGEAADSASGRLAARQLDVGALAALAVHLPFEPAVLERIASASPHGTVNDLSYDWQGPSEAPRRWRVSGRLAGLRVAAGGGWPGVEGVSGRFAGSREAGEFELSGAGTAIDLPDWFEDPRIPFDKVSLAGGWGRAGEQLELRFDEVRFENADAAGSASGWYRSDREGPGEIALSATLSRANGSRVWRYLPKHVGAQTRAWVREAIATGRVREARLVLRGELRDFPFPGGRGGIFRVEADVDDVRLAYAPGWPQITDIAGALRFEGKGMHIEARRGRVGEALIGATSARIDDLAAEDATLTIRGVASGPTASFLDFVAASPVAGWIDHFTDGISAAGGGELALSLDLPLHRMEQSRVGGEYRLAANTVQLFEGLPALRSANARIGFTNTGFRVSEASARLMGEMLAVEGHREGDGGLRFLASGLAEASALRGQSTLVVLDHLSGRTAWTSDIRVRQGRAQVRVDADLRGFASTLPAPLGKRAGEAMPMRLEFELGRQTERQRWRLALGEHIRAEAVRSRSGTGDWTLARGGVAVGAPLRLAESGLMAVIDVPELDLDAWRSVLGEGPDAGAARLAGLALRSERLRLFGEMLAKVDVRAIADAGGWRGELRSESVEGRFDWRSRDRGALKAQFGRLALGARRGEGTGSAMREAAEAAPSSLPALDITAERFRLRNMELGALSLFARNAGDRWALEKLAIKSENGEIAGKGEWRPGERTRVEFDGSIGDVGAYLAQIGYPEAVRRGVATLGGELSWLGAPTEVDYPSLGGHLDLKVEDGQFNKLEPGVGRLLGVLSLQSLPRRITLDFRDVFSEGFAFDRIEGKLEVAEGVMYTPELSIRGPAARIRLSGNVDLAAESQDLRVGVQPTLSESVAVGAALANSAAGLINPVAGLVTYLAQKIMEDPIEKLFSYQYAISGGWDDPQVAELRPAAPAATQ